MANSSRHVAADSWFTEIFRDLQAAKFLLENPSDNGEVPEQCVGCFERKCWRRLAQRLEQAALEIKATRRDDTA